MQVIVTQNTNANVHSEHCVLLALCGILHVTFLIMRHFLVLNKNYVNISCLVSPEK